MQQKAPNISLREHLEEQLSEQMELSLSLIHDVITFQGEDAAKAAHEHNEIEFSGLGKFLLSKKRVERAIQRHQDKLDRGEVKEQALEGYLAHMERMKKRIQ